MRRSLIVLVVLLFLYVPGSQAQNAWRDLSAIQPGTRVDVVDQHLRKQSGKFVRLSDTDITLQTEGREIAIPREQVYRVTAGRGRKRNTLIGMAVGGGIGLGIGLATVLAYHGDIEGTAAVGTTAFGAGVGAGIGAAIPPHTTVYRSEPLKEAYLNRPSHND